MKNTMTRGLLAAALLGLAPGAMADQAETRGGLTVKTDDGRFEFKLGGRFHIDTYAFLGCDNSVAGVGSECAAADTVGGMFLRRGYITATGKLYGWKFKSEFDPAASASANTIWREAWVSTEVLGGEIMIGQFKPFRSMEELTSSNEILMMERPYSSASGIYAGRQFQLGVGYKLPFPIGLWAIDAHNIKAAGGTTNEGIGVSTRLALLPVETDMVKTHFGVSYGQDDFNQGATTGGPGNGIVIAGRNSGTQVTSPTIATAPLAGTFGATGVGKVQSTYAVEVASSFGPGFLQAEYHNATLEQVAPAPDQDVTSYYLQGSVFLTGETKPYKKDRGTYGTPKPNGEAGAWELTARYDFIENGDITTGAAQEPEVTQITAGVNWYVNPNVRFMLNYSMGEGEVRTSPTTTSSKEVDAIALRTQLSF